MKIFVSLIVALLFNALLATGVAPAIGVGVGPMFVGLTALSGALSFLPMPTGVLPMAIQKEIWLNDIVENIFNQNPHLNYAVNADQFVLQGKVVHIPNAGSKPGVKRNRDKVPATVLIRQDVDITFVLDEYTADPMHITNAEQYELSYDKRASVISEQSNAISELVGDWFFRYWAPSGTANIARTTGGSVAAHYGTGNRKAVTVADVKAIKKVMDKMGTPAQGRVAILDPDMYDQFTSDLTVTQYRDFSAALNQAEGVVGRLMGFTFLDTRTKVLRYTNAGTPVVKDPDAAIANDDNAAALFWHPTAVIRALGDKEFFEDEGNPTYYGDIYSALVRAGGRIKRNDQVGIVALVQTAV